jgi:hypothetical protein
MQRRNALKLLAGAAAFPLLSSDALALFRTIQSQVPDKTSFKVLTVPQQAIVETMSEVIIPATDTPGAKAARVSEFIDLILSEWSDEDDKKQFLDGLAEVDRRSQTLFAKNFVEAGAPQQAEIVRGFDAELAQLFEQLQPDRHGKKPEVQRTFFFLMKHLTMVGYYTSEVGMQEERHYEIIPSAHEQCAPIPTKEQS